MSFAIFKTNMSLYMGNQSGIKKLEDFGKKLTNEYDMAVRRGYQTVNNVSVQKPNKDLMETMVNLAGFMALQKQSGLHDIINNIGKGVEMYWLGATLYQFPTPIIPATGAYQNIMTTSAMVTDPGEFPDLGNQYPTDDTDQFLDMLIMGMNIHLLTIKGMYNTLSLYPGFPQVPPAPGIVQWTGYTIPPSSKSPPKPKPPQEPSVDEVLKSVPVDNVTIQGASAVIAETGVDILDDNGQDGGATIKAMKAAAPPNKSVPLDNDAEITEAIPSEEEGEPVNCGDPFDYNGQISDSYRVRNLSLETTWPHRVKEQRGLSKEDIACNLKSLATNVLEPIKQKYPNVKVNSAFRGTASIPGRVSQHEKGEAMDVQFPGMKPQEYLAVAKWVIETLPFDQLIFEHGNSIWLHISNKKNGGNRKMVLTMLKGKYTPGLKCYYK